MHPSPHLLSATPPPIISLLHSLPLPSLSPVSLIHDRVGLNFKACPHLLIRIQCALDANPVDAYWNAN